MDNALEVGPFAMITVAFIFGAGGLMLRKMGIDLLVEESTMFSDKTISIRPK